MKYSFPVSIVIEVSDTLKGKEIETLKEVVSSQLNYVVTDMDFIADAIQESIEVELHSVQVRKIP